MRRSRPRPLTLKRVAVAVLCLGAALSVSGISACDNVSTTTKASEEAVRTWFKSAERPVSASTDGGVDLNTLAADAPSSEELDKASETGVVAGENAADAARELNEDDPADFGEAQSLVCELFVEYSGEEDGAFAPWLMGQLGIPRTPPEEVKGAVTRLEEAAREADSPEEFALQTASATLCTD